MRADIYPLQVLLMTVSAALIVACEIRTPAMQAGLVKGKLRFRDIFTFRVGRVLFALVGTLSCESDRGLGPNKCAA